MPHHPKGHLKLSGDIHLPDAESDLELERGSNGMAALAKERTRGGRPGGGVRKAGVLAAPEQEMRPARSIPEVSPDLFDATVLASRRIRSPFWKEPRRHPLVKWLAIGAAAWLMVRLAAR